MLILEFWLAVSWQEGEMGPDASSKATFQRVGAGSLQLWNRIGKREIANGKSGKRERENQSWYNLLKVGMDFISFTQEECERRTRGSYDFFSKIPLVCWLFGVPFLFQRRKKCIRHGEGTSLNLTSGSYFWHWRTLKGMFSHIYLNRYNCLCHILKYDCLAVTSM